MRLGGSAAAESIQNGIDHPRGLVTFTHEQKRHVLATLDDWLLTATEDDLGDGLMDMRDELRTTDLRS